MTQDKNQANGLKKEKDRFDEVIENNTAQPDLITDMDTVICESEPEEIFNRSDKVNFKGNGKYVPVKGTYIWAVSHHMMLMYYIEHPDGDITKERIAHNGGLPDGFETPHSRYFKKGLKYICVTGDQLEKAE